MKMKKLHFIVLAVLLTTTFADKCTHVRQCIPYCRQLLNSKAADAACINNQCLCNEPIDICFSEKDCYFHCGVNPDPSEPRDKDVKCSENGFCQCIPLY